MRNEIEIFGSVWATVNGVNEYNDNEIADLLAYDFDEWGFGGDQLEEESCICISVHFDKSLLAMKSFTDLRAALTFIALQQKEIVVQERNVKAQQYRSLRDSLEERLLTFEEREFDIERSNELTKLSDDDIEALVSEALYIAAFNSRQTRP